MTRWTVVQHSGYGYKGDPQFSRAVETRMLSNTAEVSRVEQAGGVIFEDYNSAEDFAEKANFPPEVTGIIPRVKGSFSKQEIDGLRIYIPVRTIEG